MTYHPYRSATGDGWVIFDWKMRGYCWLPDRDGKPICLKFPSRANAETWLVWCAERGTPVFPGWRVWRTQRWWFATRTSPAKSPDAYATLDADTPHELAAAIRSEPA